jgi:hypothetical protein
VEVEVVELLEQEVVEQVVIELHFLEEQKLH